MPVTSWLWSDWVHSKVSKKHTDIHVIVLLLFHLSRHEIPKQERQKQKQCRKAWESTAFSLNLNMTCSVHGGTKCNGLQTMFRTKQQLQSQTWRAGDASCEADVPEVVRETSDCQVLNFFLLASFVGAFVVVCSCAREACSGFPFCQVHKQLPTFAQSTTVSVLC